MRRLKVSSFAALFSIVALSPFGGTAGEGFTSCSGTPTMPLPSFDFGGVGYRGGADIPYKQPTKKFPAGRHTITKQMILKSGDVLRGAGRDKTVLYFPDGLKQMGLPCRDGTTTSSIALRDCFDWPGMTSSLFMGVIGMGGSEIGVEYLTIEFPASHAWTHHEGYAANSGYNGIEMKCTNCWIKNVTIKNSDNSIMVNRGGNQTLDRVHVHARPGGGHIHIAYNTSANSLTKDFRAYGTSSHGLVMNWGAINGVFANGWGENINIEPDHMCGVTAGAPCNKNMLYSNIAGKVRRFQTHDRLGRSLPVVRWNVGVVDRCPLDAYTAQR